MKSKNLYRLFVVSTVFMLALMLAACGPAGVPLASSPAGQQPLQPAAESPAPTAGSPLKVIATTTIVGDVARNVGGDAIDLSVMLPVGADPHGFNPVPADVAAVSKADIVFINGLGLEEFLSRLLESAGGNARIVAVSEAIDPLELSTDHEHEAEDHDHEAEDLDHEAEDHEHEGHDHEHAGGDPHTWVDPNNVMLWVHSIEHALAEMDPANADLYEANAEAYLAELMALDAWTREQVAQIPQAERKIITDHTLFGYFAERYGFEQIGAVVPGYSTLAAPSANELAALEDAIREQGVKAIFVGKTVNPGLSGRVAADTGAQIVFVYTGSLSEPGGEAPTYLDYIRYNVNAFVEALK